MDVRNRLFDGGDGLEHDASVRANAQRQRMVVSLGTMLVATPTAWITAAEQAIEYTHEGCSVSQSRRRNMSHARFRGVGPGPVSCSQPCQRVLKGAHDDTPRNRSKKIENVVKVPRQPGKRVRHTSFPLRGWLYANFNHVFPRQIRRHDPPVGVHAGRSRALCTQQPGFGKTSIKSHGSATLPVTRPSQSCRFQSIVAKSHSYTCTSPSASKADPGGRRKTGILTDSHQIAKSKLKIRSQATTCATLVWPPNFSSKGLDPPLGRLAKISTCRVRRAPQRKRHAKRLRGSTCSTTKRV